MSLDGTASGGVVYGVNIPPIVRRPLGRLLPVLALVAAGVACGPDPFAPVANRSTFDTSFNVWAITGSPAPYPTAYSVQSNVTLRLEPSGGFDVAFDITPGGQLQVLPVREVVASLSGARVVAVLVPGVPYEAVTSAPRSGYALDSIIDLDPGDVFVLQVASQVCAFSQSATIYAKFVVDSIFPAERRAVLSGRINPNCGFRSFADSVPEF